MTHVHGLPRQRAAIPPEQLITVSVVPQGLAGARYVTPIRAALLDAYYMSWREPTLPNGNPAEETEEYAAWETASHKAQDVAGIAWAEVTATPPTTVAGAIALINCYWRFGASTPSGLSTKPAAP